MDIKFLFKWENEEGITLPRKDDGSLNVPTALAQYNEWYKKQPAAKRATISEKNVDTDEAEENEDKAQDIIRLLGEEFKGVKGQQAVDKLMKEKRGHQKGAFRREDLGDIDLLWGNDTCGLQHIIKRREEQGINAKELVQDLADVVEKGKYRKRNTKGNFELLHNGKMAVVAPELRGNKLTFLLTAFKTTIKK